MDWPMTGEQQSFLAFRIQLFIYNCWTEEKLNAAVLNLISTNIYGSHLDLLDLDLYSLFSSIYI